MLANSSINFKVGNESEASGSSAHHEGGGVLLQHDGETRFQERIQQRADVP